MKGINYCASARQRAGPAAAPGRRAQPRPRPRSAPLVVVEKRPIAPASRSRTSGGSIASSSNLATSFSRDRSWLPDVTPAGRVTAVASWSARPARPPRPAPAPSAGSGRGGGSSRWHRSRAIVTPRQAEDLLVAAGPIQERGDVLDLGRGRCCRCPPGRSRRATAAACPGRERPRASAPAPPPSGPGRGRTSRRPSRRARRSGGKPGGSGRPSPEPRCPPRPPPAGRPAGRGGDSLWVSRREASALSQPPGS